VALQAECRDVRPVFGTPFDTIEEEPAGVRLREFGRVIEAFVEFFDPSNE
jgi:hypothetical protein